MRHSRLTCKPKSRRLGGKDGYKLELKGEIVEVMGASRVGEGEGGRK